MSRFRAPDGGTTRRVVVKFRDDVQPPEPPEPPSDLVASLGDNPWQGLADKYGVAIERYFAGADGALQTMLERRRASASSPACREGR